MNQSKLASFVEAVVNTGVGLLIAVVATQLICLLNDIPMTLENNLVLTFWMTIISVVRSYVIRRMWNAEFWKRFFHHHARGTGRD